MTKVQYLTAAASLKILKEIAMMAGNSLPRAPDGMVSAGLIGLFIGAVAQAAGHQGGLSSFPVFADDRCAEVE